MRNVSLVGMVLLATTVSGLPYASAVATEAAPAPTIDIRGDRPEDIKTTQVKDPAEPVNRGVYKFNRAVDTGVVRPVAVGYKAVVPEWGRDRVDNFLTNLSEPVTLMNSLLQGDIDNSIVTFWRFVVNTTFGIGGLFDQAQYAGLEHRGENFDQTLESFGLESGPYVMLPLFGPSTVRGTFGRVVDILSDPFSYGSTAVTATKTGSNVVNSRTKALDLTDEIERTSFDPYATIRSAYLQNTTNRPNTTSSVFDKKPEAKTVKKDFSRNALLAEQKPSKAKPKKAKAKVKKVKPVEAEAIKKD